MGLLLTVTNAAAQTPAIPVTPSSAPRPVAPATPAVAAPVAPVPMMPSEHQLWLSGIDGVERLFQYELPVHVPPVEITPFPLHVEPFEFHVEPFAFQLPEQAVEAARRAVEQAKNDVKAVRIPEFDKDRLQFEIDQAKEAVKFAVEDMHRAFEGQGPKVVTPFVAARGDAEIAAYSGGLQAMSRHQYDRAITLFDQVIARKETRVDAAIYWKAFSQFKSAKSTEAQASIAQLRRDHPQSRYLADAKVLEAEVRRQSGQPVNVEDQAVNDDIKILAIQSMQRTDPERALPLLEGVLNSANSLEVKRRAIYVLALSDDAKARQILLRYAKGAGSPDLQPDAIRYVASRRDRSTTGQDLREIYDSTQDATLRRVVIEAYGTAGDKTALMGIATSASNPVHLRQVAVSRLSNLATPQELWPLYQKETDIGLRTQFVNVFGSMGAIEQLSEIARTDKDVAVRQRAIRVLGSQRAERTGQGLIDLYGTTQDRAVRTSIIDSLASQNNASGLVAIARKETNLDLKKHIVSRLSGMAPKSQAAADYLMEMLK
jgi:HEAT repeat protein